MGRKIALVACVSVKHAAPMRAEELYRSPLFRKASAYARKHADEWYILSAKHGLVAPSKTIEPYDATLSKMADRARREWARRVISQLRTVLKPGDQVAVLAGQRYREHLIEPMKHMGCSVDVPMEGLRIGEQLRYLRDREQDA